jgi:hypothetical protein
LCHCSALAERDQVFPEDGSKSFGDNYTQTATGSYGAAVFGAGATWNSNFSHWTIGDFGNNISLTVSSLFLLELN